MTLLRTPRRDDVAALPQVDGVEPPVSAQSREGFSIATTGILAGILVVICIVAAIVAPGFTSKENLQDIVSDSSVTGILAVGEMFVILTAGIDLSIANNLAVGLVVASLYHPAGFGLVGFVVVAIACCSLVGVINGLTIVTAKIPAFIVTLATMNIATGMAFILSSGNPITINGLSSYMSLGTANVVGIPVTGVIFFVIAAIGGFVLARTPFGRSVYAVGDNREAARVSGIKVNRVTIAVYVISGLMAAIAGIVYTSFTGTAAPDAASGYELNAIAIVIIGGTNLFGGRGSMWGTFFGALIVGTLQDAFNLLGYQTPYQEVMMGLALAIALLAQRAGRRA
jgi:ribose/xylose/arabinose/galactoside ABC-type transport system permease subunit